MMTRYLRPRSNRDLVGLFRSHVPVELKIGLAVLPVAAFTVWSSMYEQHIPSTNLQRADVVATPIPPLKENVNSKVASLRRQIADRAVIDLQEDFRNGFTNWDGPEDWGRTWAHDVVLGVRPAKLAVFKPSERLKDYQFEFVGHIQEKALSWVFRASDYNNYYVMKLVQVSAGPMPTVRVIRYAVIDGEPEKPGSTPLPFPVTKDTVYRVNLDVKGELFTLYIDGKVADVWSDSRLKSGGVGFFSDKEEEGRVFAMRVSHQVDAIGKAAAIVSNTGSTK